MFVGENHILAEVKSFNYEDDIINNEEEKMKINIIIFYKNI